MKHLIVMLSLLATSAQAQVYKCIIDGKAVFSDKPCAIDDKPITVRPASGSSPTIPPNDAGQTDLTKRANLAVKRRQLDNEIHAKEMRIRWLQREMEERLEALRSKKAKANNNLAGAIWEDSISQEMNALVRSYDPKFRALQDEIALLRQQRDALDNP